MLLPLGGSLFGLRNQGQEGRFVNRYLRRYKQNFSEVYLASGINEQSSSDAFVLLPNRTQLHRYLYAFIFPVIYWRVLLNVRVVRVMQLSSLPTALIIKLLFGCKVAVTYGYNYEKFAEMEGKKLQAFLFLLVRKLLLVFADIVFYPVKRDYEFNKTSKAARYLPNGIDLNLFNSRNRRLDNNKVNLLAVGRLERQKAYPMVIESVSKIDFKTNVTLTIIGEGSLRDELAILANKYKVKLRLPGVLNNEALPEEYLRSDIFILSSVAEGVSKSLLEAAASGCALIVRKLPENLDLFNDSQECLTFSSAAELANKINLLCNDKKLRRKLGQAASERARKDYDLESVIKREIQILKSMYE